MARMLERFEARTGVPVVVNTQPQHRRPADGRRPARRAGVLRLGAGRRCWPSGPTSCAGAAVAGGAARGRARDRRRRHPDVRARRRWRRCCDRGAPTGRCRDRASSTTARGTERRRCRTPARRRGPARGRPRTGRRPQRGWRAARRRGSPSSTTTSMPARRLARGAARRPRRRPARTSSAPGPDPRAAARATAGRPTGSATSPGLEHARWITADMAYRRAALVAVGGFDERFPRAYREDADLGLRVTARGLARSSAGGAASLHPVAPGGRWVWVAQAGRQRRRRPDARLHGRDWRERAGAPARAPPATCRHRRRRSPRARRRSRRARAPRLAAARGAAGWPAPPSCAWARIAPGPRTRGEVGDDAADERGDPARGDVRGCAGRAARRCLAPRRGRPAAAAPCRTRCCFDRDGTLVARRPLQRRSRRGSTRCPARARRSTGCAPRRPGRRWSPTRAASPAGCSTASQVEAVNAAHRGAARPVRRLRVVPARPGGRLRLPQAGARA